MGIVHRYGTGASMPEEAYPHASASALRTNCPACGINILSPPSVGKRLAYLRDDGIAAPSQHRPVAHSLVGPKHQRSASGPQREVHGFMVALTFEQLSS